MPPTQPVPPDQTVSAPAYQLPPKPPVSHTARNTTLIVIGVIIVLLAIGAGLYFFTPLGSYIKTRFATLSVPSELAAATFISDRTVGKETLYQLGTSNTATEQLSTTLVSETIDPAGTARITQDTDGTFKVYLNNKIIVQDHTARFGIGRSPDGTEVVFAQASGTPTFTSAARVPFIGYSLTDWKVVLYNPSTHTQIQLGSGTSPFFIDQTHVAWIAPAGLAVIDLKSGISSVLVKNSAIRPIALTLVSPDHTVVAWYDKATKKVSAYKVTATTATALPASVIPSATNTVNPIYSLALGNDGVYMVRRTVTGSELLKEVFGQAAVHIGNAPSSYGVDRLLLGSI